MQIIMKGTLRGEFYQHRLIDIEGNVIARLYGDWVEQYLGRELAIIVLDGETDASAVWWFETMAEVLNNRGGGAQQWPDTQESCAPTAPIGKEKKEMRGRDKRKVARLLEDAICRRDCDLWDSELDQCEDMESRAECLGITEAVIAALKKEEEHEMATSGLSDPLHGQELDEREERDEQL